MRARLVLTSILAAAALAAAPAAFASGRNPQTAGLQVALRAQGLYRGSIDAISGPGTVAAVRTFQRIHGLPVTGLADARTRRALAAPGRVRLGRPRPPVPARPPGHLGPDQRVLRRADGARSQAPPASPPPPA